MTENSLFPTNDKQPDPLPPTVPVTEAPSIYFYVGLIIVAAFLIWSSFEIGEPDWPRLLINLASGIIGAVIILIFVDRRLRTSELRVLQEYAETTAVSLSSIFSNDIRSSLRYAKVFHHQLIGIKQSYYSIPAIEAIPAQYAEGFFLVGIAGSGKSTLLQRVALENAEKVIRNPKRSRIPVFLPAHLPIEDDIVQSAWKELCRYYLVNRNIFKKWLVLGRITIFINGVNENANPRLLLSEIADLRKAYPKVAIVASSRDSVARLLSLEIADTDLPIVNMPFPSDEEMQGFINFMQVKYRRRK